MVKYQYNVEMEGFQRIDRRGRVLPINITEGRRIDSMSQLGCSSQEIYDGITFNAKTVTHSTVKTFLKNVKEGNINLEGDYPAPSKTIEEMSLESRVDRLEEKMDSLLKQPPTCDCQSEKSWRNLWGKL